MQRDPFTTLRNALWIGGGQWAGKSTVAGLLAERHGLTHYHYDYHDARGLTSPRPILAEGWGLRPELVAEVTGSLDRMVVLVATEDFRRQQLLRLPRAAPLAQVSDPERAQRNRLERDRLLAEDATRQAGRLGVRVIEVDGSLDAGAVADLVAEQWAPLLPS